MAKFIRCSCKSANYRNYTIENSPINIELVTQIIKTTENYYPDNKGTPAILFLGINVKWIYEDEKERDVDYEKIANNNF